MPWNLSERLFAAYYPFVAAKSERAGQARTREELLAGARGRVLLFLEHVRAGDGSLLGRVQDLIAAPHQWAAAGCRPNRRTEHVLAASPLQVEWLVHGKQPSALPTVRPTIMGVARRV